MIRIRHSNERGYFDHGWLKTYHTFSFANYNDPQHTGFRSLRVINEDRVAPGHGFGMHEHENMEIISYVLEGALEHKDNLGNGSVLKPGEFQRMSAGTGILHSEFNASDANEVHFYQIWLIPDVNGYEPEYEQKKFSEEERLGKLQLVVSPDGLDGSLRIHQDARVFLSSLETGGQVNYELAGGRHGWLQVLRGRVRLNDHELAEGDGAALSDESRLGIHSVTKSELMLFDLA